MVDFIKVPFADAGDKTAIPNASQVDGTVSFTDGYTPDYSIDPEDPDALNVERGKQNWLFNLFSKLLKNWQTQGFCEFISASDNGGTPYLYPIKAYVRFDDGDGYDVYYSLVNANDADPTDATKWARVQYGSFVPGMWMGYEGDTAPAGWIWRNGNTIGSAASGATNRANADTYALYALLWATYPNAVLPIQTSAGAASTRGANALADFNANKRLPVIDMRGRAAFGKDDMGGAAAAGRVTTAGSGIAGDQNGAFGGAQNVSLTGAQTGPHTHTFSGTTASAGAHNHGGPLSNYSGEVGNRFATQTNGGVIRALDTDGTHTHTYSGTTASGGAGDAHQNMPPAVIGNFIVKL